jgi:hypothetical protein
MKWGSVRSGAECESALFDRALDNDYLATGLVDWAGFKPPAHSPVKIAIIAAKLAATRPGPPSPKAHPWDMSPAQVGPMRWNMSIKEVEDAIRPLTHEHLALFAPDGRQVSRSGPAITVAVLDAAGHLSQFTKGGSALDATQRFCAVDPMISKRASEISLTMTHNHPNGAPMLSDVDVALAVHMNLVEARVVARRGGGMRLRRTRATWPAHFSYTAMLGAAQSVASRRMDDVVRAAGGNPADGMSARGFSAPLFDQMIIEQLLRMKLPAGVIMETT